MDQITELGVAVVAAAALVIVAVIQTTTRRKDRAPKTDAEVARENQAFTETQTPVSPSGDRHDAAGLLALSFALADMERERKADRVEIDGFRADHTEIKSRLSVLEHSYPLLYRWAQKHIEEWDELRLRPYPLPLPEGIHHPK